MADAAPPPPLPPPPEGARRVLGQFCRFLGLATTAGSALAVIRLGHAGLRDAFFAALMLVGLLLWYAGHRLDR